MSSVVDLCNLALSHLGDDATVASIDPPEGSAQAEHCARFYPTVRDALLEMHAWNFWIRRVALAQLDVPTWSWTYAYAVPAGAIKLLAVLPPDATSDASSQPYEAESADDGALIVRTNQESASLRYTVKVDDLTIFPPLVSAALSRLLASYLAGVVVKGEPGRQAAKEQMQMFERLMAQAMVSDSNQRKATNDYAPAWISSR